MNKLEKYKQLYPDPDGLENPVVHGDGKVDLPKWLIVYFLHSTGLKTRKKRKVKKRVKRELIKLLKKQLEN